MTTYRIHFDEGTPPILREARSIQDAIDQGVTYIERVAPDTEEDIERVERLTGKGLR